MSAYKTTKLSSSSSKSSVLQLERNQVATKSHVAIYTQVITAHIWDCETVMLALTGAILFKAWLPIVDTLLVHSRFVH